MEKTYAKIVLLACAMFDDEELYADMGVETREGDEGMGAWRKGMKTTDRILNLTYRDTLATDKTVAAI